MPLLSQIEIFNRRRRDRKLGFKVAYASKKKKKIKNMFVQAGQRIENSEENYINIYEEPKGQVLLIGCTRSRINMVASQGPH